MLKHLISRHSTEDHIKQLLACAKKSNERSFLIEKVRNLGDYQHNYKVLEAGEGQIIPWRNPTHSVKVVDYLPCPSCFAFFQKSELWRHRKVCKFMDHSVAKLAFRRLSSNASTLLPMPKTMEASLRNVIFSKMVQDPHTLCARNDAIICKLGSKLFHKHGHHHHLHYMISSKMRELSRFLEEKDATIISIED